MELFLNCVSSPEISVVVFSGWSDVSFCFQESLAFMFEMAHLHEDSLREYDELELCYLETGFLEFLILTIGKCL